MKNILFLFLILPFTGLLAQQEQLDSANYSYSKGNYQKAIKLYEGILNSNVEAYEVYYNLGNAYYKSGNIPYAILNYERAKKLKPNDEDLHHNIRLANNRIPDKVEEGTAKLFFKAWYDDFINLFSEKGWSLICIALLVFSLILLCIYISNSNSFYKRLSFWLAAGVLFLTVNTFFFARAQYKNKITRNEAIIISPSTLVKGAPDDSGTKLFVLHEGTKIKISETIKGWTKVELSGNKVGWVPSNSFIVI